MKARISRLFTEFTAQGKIEAGFQDTIGDSFTFKFRYNWDRKVISYRRGETWLDWDVTHDYCHAEGDPLIPCAAEVAFVSAYNMRFFEMARGV